MKGFENPCCPFYRVHFNFTLIKTRKPLQTKEKPLIRAVFMLALRTGIEPVSTVPETVVLSVGLSKHEADMALCNPEIKMAMRESL